MRKYAVIVGGGAGTRMGTTLPKQFLELNGKPVMYYTVTTFLEAFSDLEIILVLPRQHLTVGQHIISGVAGGSRVKLQPGGETRFESVKNGLELVSSPSIVFVHDAVRCLVSKDLITRCYGQALSLGSAIPAVAATDSIRIEVNGEHRVEDRNHVRIIQTPQTFQSSLLLNAFQMPYQPQFTDEATVVEYSGEKVHLIEGEHQNLKITRPIDLVVAGKILQDNSLF
ncbi:2-C-methyl-D-erythritol 4-phosphate cytidylyltransferase [Segetibacter sp. 3557_3]|uniref:2-C-methyl-D-erythritol 4-phosphate cytidylyltransferase n=1 Tax=Segetibacter sp. 3557_3 TaxID=2547429 RepID=UPI001058FC02|nr:2-C-methyl-D-erythritol 4-phosphate cytidylyltransferase [Segetibacter sp. 3557_3]TDH27829.1 2-C-methyl-D-erythritol 4-phosphate cytidylyltransferase [Segetibacter sp. 3557_3]